MKQIRLFFFSLAVLLSLTACKTNNQEHLVQATLWYQQSAEYEALAFQAYNIARLRLDQKLKSVRYAKKPAIVLDLDETCLNNSPYAGYQIKHNKGYNSTDWKAWTSLAQADTIPGCLSFLKWAKAQPVEIFYVSNRKTVELQATIANMKAFDFPNADEAHILLKSETSTKEPRRQAIMEKHTIVMFFGDNLNDFSEEWEKQPTAERSQLVSKHANKFGYDYIILPNAGYGAWDSALFDYQYGKSAKEKKAIRMKHIKSFE